MKKPGLYTAQVHVVYWQTLKTEEERQCVDVTTGCCRVFFRVSKQDALEVSLECGVEMEVCVVRSALPG